MQINIDEQVLLSYIFNASDIQGVKYLNHALKHVKYLLDSHLVKRREENYV